MIANEQNECIFSSMNILSITVIEKSIKYNWIRNKKIQHNDIPNDRKSNYERAKRMNFLSMNKSPLIAIQNDKKIPYDTE